MHYVWGRGTRCQPVAAIDKSSRRRGARGTRPGRRGQVKVPADRGFATDAARHKGGAPGGRPAGPAAASRQDRRRILLVGVVQDPSRTRAVPWRAPTSFLVQEHAPGSGAALDKGKHLAFLVCQVISDSRQQPTGAVSSPSPRRKIHARERGRDCRLLHHGIDCQVTGIDSPGAPATGHRPRPSDGYRAEPGRFTSTADGAPAEPSSCAAASRSRDRSRRNGVQGAHEADVGWCVRLARTAAGSQADHGPNDQRRAGYRGHNPATTPWGHA